MCGAPRATIFSAKIARMGPSRGVCHTAPGAGVPHGTKGQAGVRPGTAAIRAFFAWGGPRRGSGCPPVIAAVQLDQHTLSGHPPRGIRWRRPRCLGGRLRRGLVSPALTRMRRRVVLPMAIPSRSASNSLKCEWLAPSYFVRASRPAPERRGYPYLLEKIRVTRPNQAWAADITYLPHGPGIPLPGGHHGLAQPVRGGLAIVQQLGGRLLRRRPTRDTHYRIVACGKYYPSRIPKF